MSAYCGAVHPEHEGVTCRKAPGQHENHQGRDQVWVNTEFTGMTVAERQVRRPTGRRGAQANLSEFLRRTRTTVRTAEEGKASSFRSIKEDPHNWPIVQRAIREACLTHAEVSTNEVWDLLIDDPNYTYSGDKGFMGSILSNDARKDGLVSAPVGKTKNRHRWSHSEEPVNLYRSLIYRGSPS